MPAIIAIAAEYIKCSKSIPYSLRLSLLDIKQFTQLNVLSFFTYIAVAPLKITDEVVIRGICALSSEKKVNCTNPYDLRLYRSPS
jgi:hypothetical protein